MKIYTTFLLIIFCLTFNFIGNAQDRAIDSLNASAMGLYKQNPQQALKILENANGLLKEDEVSDEKALTLSNLGIVYRDLGEHEQAKNYSNKALSITTDSLIVASAYNNLGAINRKLGFYEEAIEKYLKALSIYEAKKLQNRAATVNNNIGLVYSYLNLSEKAVSYHTKAKTIFEKNNNQKGISEAYNNIAIVYANDGELEKALDYFRYSLDIEEQLKDQKGIAESKNNVGAVHYYLGAIDSALYYFKGSATIEKMIGNSAGLAASYNNIAQVLLENKRLEDSKVYIDSAYYYATASNTTDDVEASLLNYTDYYSAVDNPERALEYHIQYAAYRDSILNLSNITALQELDVKYQTEKKEAALATTRANLAESELAVKQKNTMIFGALGLALVLGLLGYLFYNQQKLKNRQLVKEGELKTALAKIETQNKLQEQRLRISRDLHDNIGAQLTFIISSLDNLKFGFTDMGDIVSKKLTGISEFTNQTIYELRDTIWAMNKDNITLEDLQIRISNFIDKAKIASEKTHFSFVIAEGVNSQKVLTSVQGMNVYRIIQEAVNNALKYSEASKITVFISEENGDLKIEITDNGKGFDAATVEKGNGFNTIQKRAKDLKGKASITSTPGKGTVVSLSV